ncbi:sensor domain-containing protein [Mycobacteroides abscessus]|uniref:sensor domain-containing protein n=1 Tax=Mycobacteroides abscessus TaxID=36809 RepID=UPI002103EFAC|nr:sensor domain-containing protein [Mycobacteroides abscessus]
MRAGKYRRVQQHGFLKRLCVSIAIPTVLALVVSSCTNAKTRESNDIDPDSLIVSVEDVEQISNFQGFTPDGYVKKEQPTPLDPSAPAACQIVFNQGMIFGADPKAFRSVVYSGKTGGYVKGVNQIVQSVAVYSEAATAQSTFDHLKPELAKCSDAHIKNYEFTLTQPNSSTIFLDSKYWKAAYRVKSTVLASTSSTGFQHPELVTQGVLDAMTERVN